MYLHLGHVITSEISDKQDILFRRDCFISQVNNVLCYFNKLSCRVIMKLLKAYCNSTHGRELWSLDTVCIHNYDVARRKAVRRVLKFPADRLFTVVFCHC